MLINYINLFLRYNIKIFHITYKPKCKAPNEMMIEIYSNIEYKIMNVSDTFVIFYL